MINIMYISKLPNFLQFDFFSFDGKQVNGPHQYKTQFQIRLIKCATRK